MNVVTTQLDYRQKPFAGNCQRDLGVHRPVCNGAPRDLAKFESPDGNFDDKIEQRSGTRRDPRSLSGIDVRLDSWRSLHVPWGFVLLRCHVPSTPILQLGLQDIKVAKGGLKASGLFHSGTFLRIWSSRFDSSGFNRLLRTK